MKDFIIFYKARKASRIVLYPRIALYPKSSFILPVTVTLRVYLPFIMIEKNTVIDITFIQSFFLIVQF